MTAMGIRIHVSWLYTWENRGVSEARNEGIRRAGEELDIFY